jgi:ABC-type bacteriocin/lantibiotic exporter with double-glycine peptidase domain
MTIDYIQQFDASEITVARKFAGDLNFIGNGSFKSEENRSPAILSDDQNYRVVNPPGIELANVTFSYGDERPSVVEAFNLKVAPGEQVALIGPSGVGKSTVLSLILGVFDPNKGTVKIDGRAPNEFFEHCSDFVGYVGADPFVMAGTLLDNICYGHRRKYSESQIFEAIRSAQAEFLLECEGGLSYRLNENGDGLSAGQKQRLSLVRALLGRPTLLILDEATANLDQESELKIAEILKSKKGEMTVLIVSHRPGIIKYADNVVRLGSNQGPSSSV